MKELLIALVALSMFAVIEVTAKAQKDMVPSDKLRLIAQKMAARF